MIRVSDERKLVISFISHVCSSVHIFALKNYFPLNGFPRSYRFIIFRKSIYEFKFDWNQRRMAFTLEDLLCTLR